jgi:pentatricopeptide repeat protein
VEEAMKLYEESLQVYRQVGDVRGVAVTQHAMANVLVRQGRVEEAMKLYEESLQVKRQVGDVRGVAVTQIQLSQALFQEGEIIRALSMVWEAYISLPERDYPRDVQLMQGIIASMKESFPDNEQFDVLWSQAISDPQPGWLRAVQANSSAASAGTGVSDETIKAVSDFVNAPDWGTTQNVVELRQALLFQPQVEAVFERTITRAKDDADEPWAQKLEMHLAVLRMCKCDGIDATFAYIAAMQEPQESLPFDRELIPRSIEALSGGAQVRMAHGQYLATQAAQTTDDELKELLQTIQLALFGGDLAHLGGKLNGVYRQAWEAIVERIK